MPMSGSSAAEERPALLVAKSLVFQHKVTDIGRKLPPLPATLCTTGIVTTGQIDRRSHSPDGVGGCAEFVVRHMGHCHRMTSRSSSFPGSPGGVSGRCVCSKGGCPGLGHRDLATSPRARPIDCLTGTPVGRALILEKVEHVLRAVCSPQGK